MPSTNEPRVGDEGARPQQSAPSLDPRELENLEETERETGSRKRGASRTRARDDDRGDRTEDERGVSDDSELSDEEALAFLEAQWLETRLPNPPPKPGFHRIWLSTTNQYTPIAFFERLGYRPVRPSDWPGHDSLFAKSGQLSPNLISVNEMVLYEIPESRYQLYMRHMHHRLPLRDEDKIRAQVDELRQRMGNRAKNVRFEDDDGANGFAELEDRPPPARNPQFQ